MHNISELFKALGDPVRLEIVRLLAGKELCVCDILDAFDKTQPTISHHLKVLKYAGIVEDSREGKWIYYRLNPGAMEVIRRFVADMGDGAVKAERVRTCK